MRFTVLKLIFLLVSTAFAVWLPPYLLETAPQVWVSAAWSTPLFLLVIGMAAMAQRVHAVQSRLRAAAKNSAKSHLLPWGFTVLEGALLALQFQVCFQLLGSVLPLPLALLAALLTQLLNATSPPLGGLGVRELLIGGAATVGYETLEVGVVAAAVHRGALLLVWALSFLLSPPTKHGVPEANKSVTE